MAPNWEIVAIVIAGISTLFAGLAILFSFLMWRRTSRVNREEEIEWKVRVDTRLEAVGKRLETMGEDWKQWIGDWKEMLMNLISFARSYLLTLAFL